MAPPPVAGSAEVAAALAARLAREGARLAATSRLLRSVSGQRHAVWDSPAGERFGACSGTAAGSLDRIATRYAASAAAVRALAGVLGAVQLRSATAIDDYKATLPVFLHQGDLMAAAEGSPDPVVAASAEGHRALMVEAGERVADAERIAAQARDDWAQADRACAAVLSRLRADGLADSLAYDTLTGFAGAADEVGDTVSVLGPLTLVPLPPLEVADAIGTAAAVASVSADGLVLAVYGDGNPGELALRAGVAAVGPVGAVLKQTATVTRRVTGPAAPVRPGTRAYRQAMRPLAVSQRIRLGLGKGLAESFGKRANAAPAPAAAWSRPPRGLPASATWARQQALARVTAYARSAWLDDWERATASGAAARGAYVTGEALEQAEPGLSPLADRPDRPHS